MRTVLTGPWNEVRCPGRAAVVVVSLRDPGVFPDGNAVVDVPRLGEVTMRLDVRAVRWAPRLAVALLVGGLSASASAQQPQTTASITGKVSARDTSEPLSDTRVILVGTSIFTVTNAEGRYTLLLPPSISQ